MEQNPNSLLDVLRREPGKASLLARYSLAAPLAIVAWAWLGHLVVGRLVELANLGLFV